MSTITIEQSAETTPLNPTPTAFRPSYLYLSATIKATSTTFFFITTLMITIFSFVELIIGITYNDLCPINQRISTYIIVDGGCSLIIVALNIIVILVFNCLSKDSTRLSMLATCGLWFNMFIATVLWIFLFIWFIFGCIWIFGVTSRVQFIDPLNNNYCNPVLYDTSFAFLILTFLLAFTQCWGYCFEAYRNIKTGQL